MYIIFNQDGSIKKQILNDFIQQGDNNVKTIFVTILGVDRDLYEIGAIASLPNEDLVTLPSENASLTIDGVPYLGKNVAITGDATILAGTIHVNLVITSNNATLVTYNFYLTINKTGLGANDIVNMTVGEYLNLLNKINQDMANFVPYEGALQNVQLGNKYLHAQGLVAPNYNEERDEEETIYSDREITIQNFEEGKNYVHTYLFDEETTDNATYHIATKEWVGATTYTQTQVNSLLDDKADKVGQLPSFNVSVNDNVLNFIRTNDVSGLPIILNVSSYTSPLIGLFKGTILDGFNFEFEHIGSEQRFVGLNITMTNMTFGDIFSATYQKDFVESTTQPNKVYGTDANGNQTVYDRSSVISGVSDVLVDGASVVSDGVANINLTGKVDKIGPLPYFTVTPDTNVYNFLTTNNVDKKPIVLNYNGETFLGKISTAGGTSVIFEFENLSSAARYYTNQLVSNITFLDIFGSQSPYRHDFELEENKVTSLSASSTDTQYPSAKAVYDNLQNVREVAEGKCKSWVLSLSETASMTYSQIRYYDPTDGEFKSFASREECDDWLVGYTIGNSDFNSTDNEVFLDPSAKKVLIFRGVTEYLFVKVDEALKEGSVVTPNKLFKRGDVFFIIELNVPDRWYLGLYNALQGACPFAALETKNDLSGYAKLNGNNTFTGNNTFSNGIQTALINNNSDSNLIVYTTKATGYHRRITLGLNINCEYYYGVGKIKDSWADYGTQFVLNEHFFPWNDNQYNLGSSSQRWRDIYLSGSLKNNNANYGLTIPDTTSWTADKEIATTDQSFNVINASDIVNNTLTQAQYDLIINGKITRVIGGLSGYPYAFLYPPTDRNGTDAYFIGKCLVQSYGQSWQETNYKILKATKVISVSTSLGFSCEADEIRLLGLKRLNEKAFPAYPNTNPSPQALTIGANGGALSWQDPFNPTSVSLSDGGTISNTTLQANIQYHRPIVLNGFTCYFSCDDGTNYQYTSTRYDSSTNKNHINVITINKSTWVATFHTSDIALN